MNMSFIIFLFTRNLELFQKNHRRKNIPAEKEAANADMKNKNQYCKIQARRVHEERATSGKYIEIKNTAK